MVFSSIGDTTRSSVSPLQNTARSGLFATPLRSAVSGAGTLARAIFTTVFPSDCRLCGLPQTNISRLPVCEQCIAAMIPIARRTCTACGEILAQTNPWEGLTLCGACQQEPPPYRRAVAYGAYD